MVRCAALGWRLRAKRRKRELLIQKLISKNGFAKMFGQKKRRYKATFNAVILTTFGKLDEQDIVAIDGNVDRLEAHLRLQYEWSHEEAHSRIEQFLTELEVDCQQRIGFPKETVGV